MFHIQFWDGWSFVWGSKPTNLDLFVVQDVFHNAGNMLR